MELHEYPRPVNDTGIGIHWTVGYATAVGINRIQEFWLPELKAMGVKWVKIFNHDGALDFCELLLAEGMMPIVRIYRPSPNPGRLGVKELVHLDAMIRAGVRYFEFNNEPDVDAEWKGGRVPVNGLELIVDNTIANLEIVLERGGMPALPALANGSRWNLVGRIVAAGRRDLFDGPVWQALHNYSRNRPLDYPYDIGSQEGAAFTDRFYQVVAGEVWGEDAWRGRTLAEVNRLRYDRRSPGATTADDHACFLAYEHFDALNRKHIGRSIPILSTECGYLVGEDIDPRYPATSPDLHMAQTLEACRVMMGTSQRFKHAPDYYFCTAFWLLANEQLGSTSPWWESHAWFSERWPAGSLPAVRALQAEPKVARIAAEDAAETRVTLRGAVGNAGGQRTVQLERNNMVVARTALDAGSRFELPGLEPGSYLLRIEGASVVQPVELTADQREVVVALDLGTPVEPIRRSTLTGKVRGGAGAAIMLVRTADGEEWVTMAHDDGSFRFVDLPPGSYSAQIDPAGSQVANIVLDGRNHAAIDLAVTGWGYTLGIAEDTQRVGAIVASTPGRKGLRVQAHGAETSSATVLTGSAPAYGEYAALIAPLEADHYLVTLYGVTDEAGKPTQVEARVHVDMRSIPLVEFVYSDVVAPQVSKASAIGGRVVGALRAGQPLRVVLVDSQGVAADCVVDETGRFRFGGLGAGSYTVGVAGDEEAVTTSSIALDGRHQVDIELRLPVETGPRAPAAGWSTLAGLAPDAAGRTARLVDGVGNEQRQVVDAEGRFRFAQLPAGIYSLFVDGGYRQTGIEVDGATDVELRLSPVIVVWETTVTKVGSMPGFSSVRVEVEGMSNLPVRIWQGEEEGITGRTGSAPHQGQHAVEFKPLGPGRYLVEPEGLGVWATVELTGLEALWVAFRRKHEPVTANEVRTVMPALPAEPAKPAAGRVYLYVAGMPRELGSLLALLAFVRQVRPEVGQDVNAAAAADSVILLEGETADLSDVEFGLLTRNVKVQRIRGDWRSFFADSAFFEA